jgi:ubiquinone/menaquinone biosynthesis C-methylase UbiE
VKRFPDVDALVTLMRNVGFDDVQYRTFAGGIVALHTGARR